MRVSLEWLTEYVSLPDTPEGRQELLRRMEMAGLAIDAVDYFGDGAAGIVAGRVLGTEPHPGAAGLYLVSLDLGEAASTRRVVCGADNYAVGDMVPVVLAGGRLPGGDPIGAADIRGMVSDGMMCSAAELGIAQGEAAAAGILILPPDVAPGADCVPLLGLDDQVLELDLTPNYAVFCQSMLGVAREVAALTGAQLREPSINESDLTGPLSAAELRNSADGAAAQLASVEIAAPDLCGRYSGALFENLRIEPSPWWMQRRLLAAGVRPINNIVDVTNYVMLEMGQPLHAFDLDLIQDHRIIVRRARPGERLTTLDGVERELPEDAMVIADASQAVALAGVMGGANSEIVGATKRVFLESASFSRTSVRRTSRRLGLRSEASNRFEKGLDPAITVKAIERVSQLWHALGAAERIGGVIDVVAAATAPRAVEARADYLKALVGADLTADDMAALLQSLGIPAQVGTSPEGADVVRAVVPTRRLDVEGQADLAEEIARAYGYDRIEPALPAGEMPLAALPARRRAILEGRQLLMGAGLDEAVTFAYHSAGEFDALRLAGDHPWRGAIRLLNPMSEEQGVMRTSLVPNMLKVAVHNAGHGASSQALFEFGRVYLPVGGRLPLVELPEEPYRCAMLLTGAMPGTSTWARRSVAADFFALKGLVEALLRSYGIATATYEPSSLPHMHPGRTARVSASGIELGWLGELHPEVAAAYELNGRVYVAEIDFDSALRLAGPTPTFQGLPRFPALERDLAFVVPKSMRADQLETIIREACGALLEDLRLFDVYEGAQVEAGHRSLAYALRLRAFDRTLTDETADEICRQAVAAVSAAGGRLRA